MSTKITVQKLQFWLEKGYNVLLEGKPGIGKTAMIIEALNKAGLKWAYFSGSTLDPFIDFVGVPVKIDNPDGSSYIELIRPKHMASGDIDVVIIDEYNRTHKKIRNATMEMIQFGTINGKPLKDPKNGRTLVWAAINPDSDAEDGGIYDTDRLDPAQRDRFDIQVELPYDCDDDYFNKNYGTQGKAALEWWRSLSATEQDKCTPRRLEKAIKMHNDGCDLRDVLPHAVNPGRLTSILSIGPAEDKLRELMTQDDDAGRRFLVNENNYLYSIKIILGKTVFRKHFLPLMPVEKIAVLFTDDKIARSHMLADLQLSGSESRFAKPLMDLATANVNLKKAKEIREELERIGLRASPSQVAVIYNRPLSDTNDLTRNELQLELMAKSKASQSYHRKKLYDSLERTIPQNMTGKAAKFALDICGICCDKSNSQTVDRDMPNIVKISNHCVATMLKSGVFTVAQTKKILAGHLRLCKYRSRACSPSVQDIFNYIGNEQNKSSVEALATA